MLQDTGGEYGRPEQGKEKPFSEKWKERRKKYKQNSTPLQHKLARHKVLMIYRICFVVALVCVFLVCAYIHWKNLQYTDYEVNSNMNGPDHRKRTVLILPIPCLPTVKMV